MNIKKSTEHKCTRDKGTRLVLYRLVPCALFWCALLYAGETGRIIGFVSDAQTKEPLVGVNVIVEETDLGAATDFQGKYLIINVPAGSKKITASFIGYEPVTKVGVLVIPDQTVTVDFSLNPTVIEIKKPVEVTAEREMVIRTAVQTTRPISSEEFRRLPLPTLTELVGLTAGVRQDVTRGWTHIRGGRYDDVQYLIDGVQARDALIGTLWSSPKPTTEAISEVIVITGGFDPEYGEAMSGIIQAVTKEGGPKTSGKVKWTTDEVFKKPDLNFGYNRVQATLGGPTFISNRLRYFLSGEYYRTDAAQENLYWVNSPRGEYAAEGKLTYNFPKGFPLTFEGLKLTIDGHHSNYQWQRYSPSWEFYRKGDYANRVRSYKANLFLNHMLSKNTLYTLKTGWFNTGLMRATRDYTLEAEDTTGFWGFLRKNKIWERFMFKSEDWVFDPPEWVYDEVTKTWRQMSKREAVLAMYRSYRIVDYPTKDSLTIRRKDGREERVPIVYYKWFQSFAGINNPFGVPGMWVDEGDNRIFHYRATEDRYLKLDITHNLKKIHEFKFGIDIIDYKLSEYTNSLPWDLNPFWEAYEFKPLTFAAYIQDRVDFEDLVLRGGLRFDYLDAKTEKRAFPESLGARKEVADSFVKAEKKYRLSPRFGLSYPITERIKFRFSYGHFFKNPTFANLYEAFYLSAAELRRRAGLILGNPDMAAEKTVAYEMGFDAQLTDRFAFDITMFYKDIYDLSGTRPVWAVPTVYDMYQNIEYARAQGFEATFQKRLEDYWYSRLSYTLAFVKGTASTAYTVYYQGEPFRFDYYLDHDMRHQLNFDIGLEFDERFRFIPLRDLTAALIARANSGLPYTPTDIRGTQIGMRNSARMPGAFTIDGRVNKDMRLGGLRLSLFADFYNLLNSTIVTSVNSYTGRPSITAREQGFTIGQFPTGYLIGDRSYHPARDYNHDGYITRWEMYDSYVKAYDYKNNPPSNYGASRKIRFGISLGF